MKHLELPPKTGIAIQGPTTYYKQISGFYKQFNVPVVFTTWKNEPAENVLYIERSGIHVELIDVPKYAGHLNINLQNASSAHGLKYLKNEHNTQHALKVRSDSFIFGLESLWPKIYGCEMSWTHIYNPVYNLNWAYNINGHLHTGMNWIVDFASFGNIDASIYMYDWQIHHNYPVPPESMYMNAYLIYKNTEHKFDADHLKQNGVVFFGKYFNETNSDLYCIKHHTSYRNLINAEPHFRLC
jgi:hypothetical protein